MAFEEHSLLYKSELYLLLKRFENVPELSRLITEPLAGNTEDGFKRWSLLPMLVCESVSGMGKHAAPVSAAIHLLMKAADIFDDIEDEDSLDSLSMKRGRAVAINTASAMLVMAEKALTRLPAFGVSEAISLTVIESINEHYIDACIGQHRDIYEELISEEQYFQIAEGKSGAQVAAACHAGALVGEAGPDIGNLFEVFGRYLGIAAQLVNDIQGISNLKDIERRKITLPVVFALEQAPKNTTKILKQEYFGKNSELNPEAIKSLLFSTGAVYYATIKLSEYRNKAAQALSRVESSGINVSDMRDYYISTIS